MFFLATSYDPFKLNITKYVNYLSIHLPIYLSIHPSIHSFIYQQSIHPSNYRPIQLPIHPPIHPSVHLPTHPYIHWPIHLFIRSFIHLRIYPFIYLPIHHLPTHPSIHINLWTFFNHAFLDQHSKFVLHIFELLLNHFKFQFLAFKFEQRICILFATSIQELEFKRHSNSIQWMAHNPRSRYPIFNNQINSRWTKYIFSCCKSCVTQKYISSNWLQMPFCVH